MIPFNKPFATEKELIYIKSVLDMGKISGNGMYTKLCQTFFEENWKFQKTLLTTSCTDALEMCAILLDIKPDDEIIMPSYTFVSTALAFIRQGAIVVFADSRSDHPGIDENKIEELITSKTKALVPVHYAGVSCDMSKIMNIAQKHNLFVVEDAAQAIDNYYINSDGSFSPLGGIGQLGTFSFHETKNIQSGEGGLIAINDEQFSKRAEIIWEKGTNRAEFYRGEINKYGWVDIGSSFLQSEILAAFLFAQLEQKDKIKSKRLRIWNKYYDGLSELQEKSFIKLPKIPNYSTNNGHMFYIVCRTLDERSGLIEYLKKNNIMSVFHYQSLHNSDFYKAKHDGRVLKFSDQYSELLLRLPLFYELTMDMVELVIRGVESFFYHN